MLFSSLEFLVYFLPAVLGVTFLIRMVGNRDAIIVFLILASWFFYAWTFPPYLYLLLGSLVANFAFAQLLSQKPKSLTLFLGIAFNIALLGWFKYAGFLADTANAVAGLSVDFGEIVLPLAISFFTFQQIAFLADIAKGKTTAGRLIDYLLFISFFPQLIAGPIVHHRNIVPQLKEHPFAKFLASDMLAGVLLFSLGLAKKTLIADNLRFGGDRLFHATELGLEPSLIEAWFGMLCYTFQIYFDFSGYSDMAIGLGRMFGLRLPINFFSPYKAASISDFWRRWNMTLSEFLRDYIYFPLGGNRKGHLIRYVNLFIVMLVGGLWHGASWTFVIWGGLHGGYLTLNHFWRKFVGIEIPHIVGVAVTFLFVVLAWVFFRAETFADAFVVLKAMMALGESPVFAVDMFSDVFFLPAILLAASVITWFSANSLELVERLEKAEWQGKGSTQFAIGTASMAAFSIFVIYSTGTYEFLYFQF